MSKTRQTVPEPKPEARAEPGRYRLAHPLRVRWAEADMQGVVFNAHYLAWFDIGITEYLRALAGGDEQWLAATFDRLYVVKSTLEYRSPARFDDALEISARCIRIGRTSLEIGFAIQRAGQVLVTGSNVYVHTIDTRPAAVPDDLRRRIERFENEPEA
jgi:acyl-CoA thioester hydrolase